MRRVILFFAILMAVGGKNAYAAADLSASCNGSGCTPSTSTALFPSTEVWYPNKSLTKTIRITNDSAITQTVGTKAQNTSQTGNVDTVLSLSIRRSSNNQLLWSGSLNNFFGQTLINLGTFAPASFEEFIFTLTMEQAANNSYQGKTAGFDLLLGFWEETTPTPTPTNAPTATPTPAPGGGGGDGGTVLGAGVSAPVCNDTKPGSAPSMVSAIAGVNSVILNWTQAADPVTYYLVTYGLSSGAQTYGNPNIGGKGTTTYTVSGLSGGTTYYFKVRAGNGCAPGDYSSEISATVLGVIIPSPSPAPGFAEGVLGEQTLPTPEPGVVGEVKGTEGAVTPTTNNYLPLIILTVIITGGVIYFWKKRKTQNENP